MLFTRATSCIKSKGLPIEVPYFTHLILFVHTELADLDWRIIILFIHINHRRMKSKGHLYIYIYQVFSKI
jgi:hypothetical protein